MGPNTKFRGKLMIGNENRSYRDYRGYLFDGGFRALLLLHSFGAV